MTVPILSERLLYFDKKKSSQVTLSFCEYSTKSRVRNILIVTVKLWPFYFLRKNLNSAHSVDLDVLNEVLDVASSGKSCQLQSSKRQ
jgi:hypothetical protein